MNEEKGENRSSGKEKDKKETKWKDKDKEGTRAMKQYLQSLFFPLPLPPLLLIWFFRLQKPVWRSAKNGSVIHFKSEAKRAGLDNEDDDDDTKMKKMRNLRGEYGETVLHIACLFGNREVAFYLIDQYPVLTNLSYQHPRYKGTLIPEAKQIKFP